jgi:hypothetical protein
MSSILYQADELTIDPFLYEHGYKEGCSPFQCNGTCCSFGVYCDVEEHKKIVANAERIKNYLDETQPHDVATWFEKEFVDDADFPSGKCIGTEVYNNKCVFLNKEGKCSLQLADISEGKFQWDLKPFYCIAFPLAVINKQIEWDDMIDGQLPCCTAHKDFSTPIADACKLEMDFILGK